MLISLVLGNRRRGKLNTFLDLSGWHKPMLFYTIDNHFDWCSHQLEIITYSYNIVTAVTPLKYGYLYERFEMFNIPHDQGNKLNIALSRCLYIWNFFIKAFFCKTSQNSEKLHKMIRVQLQKMGNYDIKYTILIFSFFSCRPELNFLYTKMYAIWAFNLP